jgi:hypothetical protein
MAIVLNAAGEGQLLNDLFNTAGLAGLKLKLYTNTLTLTNSNVAGSFTEPTGVGYTATTLNRGASTWTVSSASSPATATYTAQAFTFTGSASIQGYFVTDSTGTYVVWAEAFPSAVPVSSALGLTVTPRFGLGNVGTGTGSAGA